MKTLLTTFLAIVLSGLTLAGCHQGRDKIIQGRVGPFPGGGGAVVGSGTTVAKAGDGQSGEVNKQLATPLSVTVVTANSVPIAGLDIQFLVTSGGGTLSTTSVKSDATGRAETILTLGTVAGSNSVSATIPGIPGTQTFTATAIPGPASSLVFEQGPSIAPKDGDISPQIAVRVKDAYGNNANSTASITLSLGLNPGGGALSFGGGSSTVAAVGGLATFPKVSIDMLGNGYTLIASSAGLPNVESASSDTRAIPADDGLGHPDSAKMNFSRTSANDAVNPSSFSGPVAVAVDTVGHRLFVSDRSNNRVLVFALSASNTLLATNKHATNVLGQTSFTSVGAGLTQSTMNVPGALDYDEANKRLYVCDFNNNRVLVFDLSSGISDGMNASFVLGQANFTANATGNGNAQLNKPNGVVADPANNRVFVSDQDNHRVLVHSTAALASGQAASNVIGQAGFGASAPATTQAGMRFPVRIAHHPATNRLFVADRGNHRVLVHDVAVVGNGQNATNVLGQVNFTSMTTGTTASTFNIPVGVAYDGATNRLFVADRDNRRVLVFNSQTPNGVSANNVLGQANLTSNALVNPPTAASLNVETVTHDGAGTLWVVDLGNNRVLQHATGSLADNQNATDGIGHTDGQAMNFSRGAANDGVLKPYAMNVCRGVGIDTVGHRLFVSDTTNNRVLVFSLSANNDLLGQSHTAIAALGQPDLVSGGAATAQNRLNQPRGLAWDATLNRLYVADLGNNRVLVFDNAGLVTNGNALRVLGQPNFTSNGVGTTATTMSGPRGVEVDPGLRVFVADTDNSRVLTFDNTAAIANGAAATSAVGQPNLNSGTAATTQAGLRSPQRAAYDSATKVLYVVDGNNHRVTTYDMTASAGDGRNAIHVLGQPNFMTMATGTSRTALSVPVGVTVDSARKRLFIVDSSNHRILVHSLTGLTSNQPADTYIGQSAGFDQSGSGSGNARFNGPARLALDPTTGRIFATDQNNRRIMTFLFP